MKPLHSAIAVSLLAFASAAVATPGEIASSPSRAAQPGSTWASVPAFRSVQPGDSLLERARHVHRFEGARAALADYERAAAAGSAQAMTALGGFYARGEIVARDEHRALEYLYEAALRDEPAAMLALAGAFHHGDGVARDEALARYWLVRAAETGYRPAMEARRRLATR